MHKQVSGWTVNFGPNFPEYPFLELKTRIPPPPPFRKTSDLGWPKFTLEYPPIRKTSDLGWPKFTLEYPPPIWENFRFGMTKVYSGIPPPIWKTSDLGWPKFTPEYPPSTFRKTSDLEWPKFTPEYPPIRKTSDLGWPKFTPEYLPPTFWKTSDLGWPKFTPEYPPNLENFRFGMTKVYSRIPPIWENFRFGMTKVYSRITPPPHFGKLQIWDDQSLLWNTPLFGKTSDLGWPKFTPENPPTPPPIWENFRFGMTKVYSEIPPQFGKLQIWDDQSLLWNTPPQFGKLQIWDDQSLLWNTPPPQMKIVKVQVWDFQNTDSYYMWRLYPTRITTSSCFVPLDDRM